MKTGNISVSTENIFPIIKQFLYSDQEIFLRELVSNAVDATSKLRTLALRGEVKGEVGDTHIDIILDEDARTLTIRDRGIGMTEAEAERYLNQVAFSSAQEFLDKYKADGASIIGHFGMGFYSAFMVAKRVEAVTKSYKTDSTGVTWACEGNTEFTLGANDKTERGTDIVLYLTDEDAEEYGQKARIKELLDKYCKFLPVEIFFDGEKINNPNPIWKKSPTENTDEEYKAFYQELYPYSAEPLFHIHLNIDYPFNLTGILYFPLLKNTLEVQKNKIHLYCNQVYVTDEVKDIVPDFLQLLHGVIDSPDIPLNVSRSALQADRNVKRITSYITKKVADKLEEMFKNDRADFEHKWENIGTFIKYGMLTDEKFGERGMKFALLQNTEKQSFTLEEYQEKVKAEQTDKNGKTVLLYTHNAEEHDAYIKAANAKGYDILLTDVVIDGHFMQMLESKLENVACKRVDADTIDRLVEKDNTMESVLTEAQQETVKNVFTDVAMGKTVELRALAATDAPVQIVRPEFMRRFAEMQRMQGQSMEGFGDMYNIVVNTNHPLVTDKLLQTLEADRAALATYLYDLARLQQNLLKGADLTAFVQKSMGFL
jgi:molecular chaperone HtpG